MKDAIVRAARPPEITMSVDSTAYFGLNRIRRNVAKSTSLYIGRSAVDRIITVPANSFMQATLSITPEGDAFDAETRSDVFFTENTEGHTKALYITTNNALIAHINGNIELHINRHMFLDHPVHDLALENVTCHEARVVLAYIV